MTDALSRLVSWSCSRPKPAMHGCSTALICSPLGSPEMAKLNRSRSWKPRPRLPSNGRAAIGSMARRSSIRIRIPVAPLLSSDTQPTNSSTSNSAATLNTAHAVNFKYVWLATTAHELPRSAPDQSGDDGSGAPRAQHQAETREADAEQYKRGRLWRRSCDEL